MFDQLDPLGPELLLFAQREQAGQGLVIAAAAGPRLDARTFLLQEVDLAEKLGHGRNVALIAAEIIGVTLPALDDVRVCRKSLGRELGGDDAVARHLPRMEGLGHGAEVAPQASGLGTCDAQGHAGALHVQLQQFAGCSRSGHRAVDGGGVPIAVCVNVGAQPGADLIADDPCREHIAAGQVQLVCECKHCRRKDRRGMPADTPQVIEVFSVARRSIGERSGGARGADIGRDDARLRVAALLTGELENDFTERRSRAVSSGANIIKYRLLGLLDCCSRNLIILCGDNPARQGFGSSHCGPPEGWLAWRPRPRPRSWLHHATRFLRPSIAISML